MKKIEELFGQMVAAEVYIGGNVSVSLIKPYAEEKNGWTKFYWDNGPSRCSARFVDKEGDLEPGEARVVHVYGKLRETDDHTWDAMDLHFLTTYYPAKPSDPPQPDFIGHYFGWIAPNGDYYIAPYGSHDGVARTICASLFGQVMGGVKARELLIKTWLQARNDGNVYGRMDTWDITKSQLATIKKIEKQSGIDYGVVYELRKVVADPQADDGLSLDDATWAKLVQDAMAIKWAMFACGAQPTKSDVEDVLMDRYGMSRYWPHTAMNHLEQNDILGASLRQRQWVGEGAEPQLTPDIIQHVLTKARRQPVIQRTLSQGILDILEENRRRRSDG